MAPFSNAIATITLQDQDLLSPGLANLVQRVNRTVTFPANNGVFYAGYGLAGAATVTLITGITVPFLYLCNVGGASSPSITMQIQSSLDSASRSWVLFPGAVFMVGSPTAAGGGVQSGVLFVSLVSASPPTAATYEYLYAY